MSEEKEPLNFIEYIVEEDLKNGMNPNRLRFRFPPEPNGYLHIGHTKAIGISFGLGEKHNAPVNLRFDDTNPAKEEQEYVDAIKEDITWLGYSWANEVYSSDYFQQLFEWAVQMINDGKAYVDSQSSEAMAEQKGSHTEVGTNSPYRDRSLEENLDLFLRMKDGEFDEGTHVLRAKIDMTDPNLLMRDPLMYRILKKTHHRTGDDWCIYPMYDWTHGESDYIEQVSHSLCSLEFKPHRKLYNWFRDVVYNYGEESFPFIPHQTEFARLNLSYTIMSKRKLLKLVEEGIVNGWDDPRMPTISGLRRRGYTPMAIRNFIKSVGVAKRENVIDVSLLEFHLRADLNKTANRVMAVLDPVKLIITNYPDDKTEFFTAENNPEDANAGSHEIPFSKTLFIEKEDFKENAGNKFFRLTLDGEVRLKNGYIIKAENAVKDSNGEVVEIHCSFDPDSLSGSGSEASSRKVKGTLHWVSVEHAIKAEVRIYDRLFNEEAPDGHKDKSYMDFINPASLKVTQAFVEPALAKAVSGDRFQFQRLGYFSVDSDSTSAQLVFNKTVGLRDSWAKQRPNQASEKPKQQHQVQPSRPPIEEIKKLGKKYTNLPLEKQLAVKATIQELATNVSFEDLEPLFATAAKKAGTRIAATLTLGVLLNQGQERTSSVMDFIMLASVDVNDLLAEEAKALL